MRTGNSLHFMELDESMEHGAGRWEELGLLNGTYFEYFTKKTQETHKTQNNYFGYFLSSVV